jgi:hypothetical protein
MKFAKIIFTIAGIYGLLALVPVLLLENRIAIDTPPAITHPEYFYGFLWVGIAWQIAFLTIGRDPARYRWLMVPSMIEKFGFGLTALGLFTQSRLSGPIMIGVAIDLVLGILFAAAFVATRAQDRL